jgi:phage-related minor tail protein
VSVPGLRREGLVRVLTAVREVARTEADDLLSQVPDTGDSATGRAVDDFVEQAADALRALGEAVTETLRRLSVAATEPDEKAAGAAHRSDAYPSTREGP